jgi:hypothetical protein
LRGSGSAAAGNVGTHADEPFFRGVEPEPRLHRRRDIYGFFLARSKRDVSM